MRFEKWQALGNDYLIVEHDELPFELTPARVRRLCDGHFGVFADGVLLLSPPERRRARGRPAHLQPRRLGGRAVGQRRARGDPVPAPARLDRRGQLLDPHRRRDDPPARSPARSRCRVDMGQARLSSKDFPSGPPDGAAELRVGPSAAADAGRRPAVELPARLDRQPAVRHRAWPTRPRSAALDLGAIGPPIEAHPEFPNRTNVSWYAELERRTARAHPRAHLRARRGGDAVLGHRRDRCRGRLPARRLGRAPRPGRPREPRARRSSCWTAASSRSRWTRICTCTCQAGRCPCSRAASASSSVEELREAGVSADETS